MAKVPPITHHARRGEIIKFLVVRTIANFLILVSPAGLLATFGPTLYYEIEYRTGEIFGVEYVLPEDSSRKELSGFGKLIEELERRPEVAGNAFEAIVKGEREQIIIPKSSKFSIVIPKIGANENVISNVDPSNKDEYLRALSRGVAHAKGTSFPGLGETTYLFAHSADNFWNVGRYNAVFYLIGKLNAGDEIDIFFQGVRYKYFVEKKEVVNPEQVEFITRQRGQGEELILQTCYPPGTTWKRLLVFARPA